MEKSLLNVKGCVWILLVLHAVMLSALFTRTVPHPPFETPLFALGPFLGAVLAIGVYALVQLSEKSRNGYWASFAVASLSLISFGPQKLLTPEFAQIWPAVVLGMISAVVIIFLVIKTLRRGLVQS